MTDAPLMSTPFTSVEELNHIFDSPDEPNLVHLEIHTHAPLDPRRLHAAVHQVANHPLIRRKAAGAGWDRRTRWSASDSLDAEPLEHANWRHEGELAALRDQVLSTPVPVTASPLFRITHAVGPGWDVVFLRTHHAAYDGVASLALLNAITCAYRDRPVEITLADEATTTAVGRPALPRAPQSAARIARDGGRTGASGYGSVVLSADIPRSTEGTVNDVLVAGLALAAQRWNSARGRSADVLRITVPVNARSAERRWHGIGNCSRLMTVTITSAADSGGLVADVARQTMAGKAAGGPPVPLGLRLLSRSWAPATLRRRTATVLRALAGTRLTDTSMVSNLGVPAAAPRFGEEPEPLWFSVPAPMPRGLSIGVVTAAGSLRICIRHRRALLGPSAAAGFSAAYLDCLAELAKP